jgi:hypothetical protein
MMLLGISDSFEQAWLIALLAVWAVLLFGGFAFGRLNAEGTHRMPTWTRIGSSLTLVVAAWSWCVFTRNTTVGAYSILIAVGMSLGCLGDIFLAEILPLKQPVFLGILYFGLGHVTYIVAILSFANANHFDAAGPRWGAEAIWLLIGLVAWYLIVYRGGKPSMLHYAALPYALLLASTAGFATGLALQASAFVPLAVGGALFLLSDLILATELFNSRSFPLIGDVIWLAYGPAQAFIVYSVGVALMQIR